jgi:tRNA(Arg) A34 adenosine deaminase TadA
VNVNVEPSPAWLFTQMRLYTTFRPCPMCETAAHWAGIARIYHGDAMTDGGPPRYPRC